MFERSFKLKNFHFALVAAAVLAGVTHAGPFRRKASTVACVNGVCPQGAVEAKPAAGNTSTAQSTAILIVQTGRFRHWGNPMGGFEGIGMGATAQQAIQNCCYWGKRQAIDIGTAQMRSGQWVAVVRYR